jgi:hypothetical protein
LKYPIIAERIRRLLNEETFKDEFSHTILHNQNVFDEFKALQQKKKADEEKKQREQEEEQRKKELEKQLSNMKLNDYKPKYGQDPQLFNAMYINYINQLTQESTPEATSPTTNFSAAS